VTGRSRSADACGVGILSRRRRAHNDVMAETPGRTPDRALAMDVVRLYGNNDGRTWFAGVRLGGGDDEIVVFRRPHVDFDGAVTRLVPDGVHVAFVDAPHSRAELLEARERVFDLTDEIGVVDVRLPADGTTLAVEVAGAADEAAAVLRNRVPGLAEVVAAAGG
jgi:hypothetical protein